MGSGPAPGGPYFDDLSVGQVFDSAPSMTLTPGVAAAHQAIIGDRLRLALDGELAHAVTGVPGTMAHPGLVCDRFPTIGDTLFTRTEVVGLRQNSARPGRPPTGLAVLRMTTVDQVGRLVLDFHRCAMLPLSAEVDTGHADDLDGIGAGPDPAADATAGWDAAAFRERVPGPHFRADIAGRVLRSTADVVTSAPELARLTLNVAAVHHDSRAYGQRLVYGGHTIGLALAQATRLLPNLVTVLGWQACDHTGPVHEGDTLYSDLHVESAQPLPDDRGGVLGLRSVVFAAGADADRPVLDWRYTALLF